MRPAVVGIDVGGANLKAARWVDSRSARAAAVDFPMWKEHRNLAAATKELLSQLSIDSDTQFQLAVTMTGELADCFDSRATGVREILKQLNQVHRPDQTHVYSVDGQWLSTQQAIDAPWDVAASNWHALANWLGQWSETKELCQRALIVDIGSTTVDVIPMLGGKVATSARTDRERLQLGQLVYTGLSRTPICAVVQQLRLADQVIPVMAELFATVDDAWQVLGEMPEDPHDCATADGRPRTQASAAARLARVIGEDRDRLPHEELISLADQVVEAQALQIAKAILRNYSIDCITTVKDYLIYSGHGLPLWRRVVRTMSTASGGRDLPQVALTSYLSQEVSRCAPAAAVAWLMAKHFA